MLEGNEGTRGIALTGTLVREFGAVARRQGGLQLLPQRCIVLARGFPQSLRAR